jgi:Rieske Fe-S protein
MTDKKEIGKADLQSGGSRLIQYKGEEYVLVNAGGDYRAYSTKCTHLGCQVMFKDGVLRCPCHSSQFDPLSGAVVKGPAKKPLKSLEVAVEDGVVKVKGEG